MFLDLNAVTVSRMWIYCSLDAFFFPEMLRLQYKYCFQFPLQTSICMTEGFKKRLFLLHPPFKSDDEKTGKRKEPSFIYTETRVTILIRLNQRMMQGPEFLRRPFTVS